MKTGGEPLSAVPLGNMATSQRSARVAPSLKRRTASIRIRPSRLITSSSRPQRERDHAGKRESPNSALAGATREGVPGLLRDKTRPSNTSRLAEVAERILTLADPTGETTHCTAEAMARHRLPSRGTRGTLKRGELKREE
jgi:hypothetical protein